MRHSHLSIAIVALLAAACAKPAPPELSDADKICAQYGRSVECLEARQFERNRAEQYDTLEKSGFFEPNMKPR